MIDNPPRQANLRSIGTKILIRLEDFLGTPPDESANRRRFLFFLVLSFVVGITIEIFSDDDKRLDIIKEFTNAIIWLAGIYTGGYVVTKFARQPLKPDIIPHERHDHAAKSHTNPQ